MIIKCYGGVVRECVTLRSVSNPYTMLYLILSIIYIQTATSVLVSLLFVTDLMEILRVQGGYTPSSEGGGFGESAKTQQHISLQGPLAG